MKVFIQNSDSVPHFCPSVQSIEDPFDQDDWENWAKFTASVDIQVRQLLTSVSRPGFLGLTCGFCFNQSDCRR